MFVELEFMGTPSNQEEDMIPPLSDKQRMESLRGRVLLFAENAHLEREELSLIATVKLPLFSIPDL